VQGDFSQRRELHRVQHPAGAARNDDSYLLAFRDGKQRLSTATHTFDASQSAVISKPRLIVSEIKHDMRGEKSPANSLKGARRFLSRFQRDRNDDGYLWASTWMPCRFNFF